MRSICNESFHRYKHIINSYACDWKDFEDAVQYHAAKRWKADCVVTRYLKDFVQSEITIYTPDEFVAFMQEKS